MTDSGKISVNGKFEAYGKELEDMANNRPPPRPGRLLGGSPTYQTQTTTTETTTDNQPQSNVENSEPKQSTTPNSAVRGMKIKDMRSGKQMNFLEMVPKQ